MPKTVLLFLLVSLILYACQISGKHHNLHYISWEIPKHFPEPSKNLQSQSPSLEGIALGKKIFADPILSQNNSMSCLSCHNPKNAFSDRDKKLSIGIKGKKGRRNTQTLFNLMWHNDFFWDGGAGHLQLVPLNPITDTLEMASSLKKVIAKLNSNSNYKKDFKVVFGSDSITSKNLLLALEQFMASLISSNSRYDLYLQGKTILSELEKEGLRIFRQKCASCHKEPLLSDFSYRNNGLDRTFTDLGRYRITIKESDKGKFKVPSLRNITLSPPYMHDGRFETLEEVLEHYDKNVKKSPTLDPLLNKNGVLGIKLSEKEKKALLAFFETLEDTSFGFE